MSTDNTSTYPTASETVSDNANNPPIQNTTHYTNTTKTTDLNTMKTYQSTTKDRRQKIMDKDALIGNITTLIKVISMILAGYTIGILTSQGLQLPITETQLTEAISTILFIVLAYLDAKYSNTFKCLGNNKEYTNKIITTDELSEAIKQASEEEKIEEIIVEHNEVIGDDQQ